MYVILSICVFSFSRKTHRRVFWCAEHSDIFLYMTRATYQPMYCKPFDIAPGAVPWIPYVWEFKRKNNQSQDKSVSEWKPLNMEAYEHRKYQMLFFTKTTSEWDPSEK